LVQVGVVLDVRERAQRFFFGHDAEITSLALSPSRALVATGQVASLHPLLLASPCVP
jgi:hypothetical protein